MPVDLRVRLREPGVARRRNGRCDDPGPAWTAARLPGGAPGHGFSASSVNYGVGVGKDACTERFLAGVCPIVASYGARDRANRKTASRLGQALQALGVDHDVKEYPGAGHAFLNDHDSAGDPNPVIFVVMGKFAGPSGYHEPSARDARRRIVAFFSAHLR